MIGSKLSHYKITAELGRGGMGIVYRATDTKLNRDVAIKVLPAAALASDDDRARFFREAQAAAQLSHPNIATVYQIDEAIPVDEDGSEINATDGPRPFIAMEFIEGETLGEHIKKGPMKLKTAVKLATQVAEALKAAHAKDIVHRDIKSANVMLTPEGVAKVLDFGLAKTNQSTMLTRLGSTLGTINYMSPEQARGEDVDSRSDLYSLGTMLYEMVVGKTPFAGEYEQAVVYSILNENPPPLTARRTGVPMQLEWIVNKLLAKEADGRYQSAGEVIVDLKSVDLSSSGYSQVSAVSNRDGSVTTAPMAAGIEAAQNRFPVHHILAGIGILCLGLLIGWGVSQGGSSDRLPAPTSHKLYLDTMPNDVNFLPQISPTGKFLTYAGVSFSPFSFRVVINDLETGEQRFVPRSDSMVFGMFNETEEWLLLSGPRGIVRTNADGSLYQLLKKFSASANNILAIWEDSDHILFTANNRPEIFRMRIDGSGEELIFADSTLKKILPTQILGNGSRLLTSYSDTDDNDFVGIVDLQNNSLITIPGEGFPRIVQDRFLISHSADSTLMVTELDSDYNPVGSSIPVLNKVLSEVAVVAPDGSLFYLDAKLRKDSKTELFWLPVDGGAPVSLGPPIFRYFEPVFSLDGQSVAYIKDNGGDDDSGDLFRLDLDTGVETQLTFSLQAGFPDWYGDWIYFQATVGEGVSTIYRINAAGGRPEVVVESPEGAEEPNMLPDGSGFVFVRVDSTETGDEIWFYDMETTEQRELVTGIGIQSSPVVSPDGRYVAYESNEGEEVYSVWVSEFDGDGLWKVSGDARGNPDWSPDGETIFFDSNGSVFKRSIKTEGAFRILSESVLMHNFGFEQDYAVSPDGKRLFATSLALDLGETAENFTVITHWVDQIIEMLDERKQK